MTPPEFEPLSLLGCGFACGSGASREAVTRAVAPPVTSSLKGHGHYFDAAFNPLTCGFADLDRLDGFVARTTALASQAITDCLLRYTLTHPFELRILLPAPDQGTGLTESDCTTVAQAIQTRIAEDCDAPLVGTSTVLAGPAALGDALQQAAQARAPTTVIVAADSYADRGRLDQLLAQNALFSRKNPWGLLPGEGAGAMCVGLPHHVSTSRGVPRIAGLGLDHEAVLETAMDAETDYAAISRAVRSAAQAKDMGRIGLWVCDRGLSRYRASEIAHAVLRAGPDWLEDGLMPDCIISRLGDCGIANGMAALWQVLDSFDAQTTDAALVTLGSQSGARAAISLSRSGSPSL